MRYVYRLSVTVPEPDYALTLAADRYTATPGKPLDIPVTIERRDGFDGPIEIQATGLPEGVTSTPVTSLPSGDSAKSVTLQITSASGPISGPFRVVGVSPKQGREGAAAIEDGHHTVTRRRRLARTGLAHDPQAVTDAATDAGPVNTATFPVNVRARRATPRASRRRTP